jgi:ribonuclease HI
MIRICALPPSNPVYDQAIEYFVKPSRTHHTNVQKMIELFNIDPTVYETVPAVSRPPVFQPPIDVLVADSKEEALELELKDAANMKIYTDGSCQNGTVGASAVLYYTREGGTIGNPAQILCCKLGPDTRYSVWEAEAAGIIMALWLLRGSNRISRLPISIYSDSQAVLKAIRAQRASPGFQLIKESPAWWRCSSRQSTHPNGDTG